MRCDNEKDISPSDGPNFYRLTGNSLFLFPMWSVLQLFIYKFNFFNF